MYKSFADRYQTPCVVVESDDKSVDVIAFAKKIGAIMYDGANEILVVQFPGHLSKCYSENALARSFWERYERETTVPGIKKVVFFTEEDVPKSVVTSIGELDPHRGPGFTAVPITIGGKVIQVFSVISYMESGR